MCFLMPPVSRRHRLERREVEKRIYMMKGTRLTASAAFHGIIIREGYVQALTEMQTVFEK